MTPPNTDKTSNKNDEDDEKGRDSPKLVQDTKKRVVEADKSGKKQADGAARNDPSGSGHSSQGGNMVAKNINNDKSANATAVSAGPSKDIKTSDAKPNTNGDAPASRPTLPELGDIGQRVTRSALRRGRPRRNRALSVDPPEKLAAENDMMEMLQSINTSMANSELQLAKFENDVILSLNAKLSEIKNTYDSNVVELQTGLIGHEDHIKFCIPNLMLSILKRLIWKYL